MDKSLDESIQSRQDYHRPSRPSKDHRPPRDGIRKVILPPHPPSFTSAAIMEPNMFEAWQHNYRRDDSRNLDRDWLHDRYDEDSEARPSRDSHNTRLTRRDPISDPSAGAKLKIENLHYDLNEDDLRELFTRIGPVVSINLLYDRQDRSTGTAYVAYADSRDARTAISEFDGANAHNQPIRISLVPMSGSRGGGPGSRGGDIGGQRQQGTGRSLFERVEGGGAGAGAASGAASGGGRRRGGTNDRDEARRSNVSKPPPEHIDRYVPGGGSSSGDINMSNEPNQRARGRGNGNGSARSGNTGAPRTSDRGDRGDRGARRPGQKRQPRERTDADGHPIVQGRPRKTAEELDAEMSDYWGTAAGEGADDAAAGNGKVASVAAGGDGGQGQVPPATSTAIDGDIDMDA